MAKKPYLMLIVGLTLNLLRLAPTYFYRVFKTSFIPLLDTTRTKFFAETIIEIISFIKIICKKLSHFFEISLLPLSHTPNYNTH